MARNSDSRPQQDVPLESRTVVIDCKELPHWRNAPRRTQPHAAGPFARLNIVGLEWYRRRHKSEPKTNVQKEVDNVEK